MGTKMLHNQRRFSPHDEANRSTTRYEVSYPQRDLGTTVDQRYAVMSSPQAKQVAGERGPTDIRAAEVPISDGNHLTPAGIHKTGIVDTRRDSVTTVEEYLLRTVEAK